jgi:hypothetical protein
LGTNPSRIAISSASMIKLNTSGDRSRGISKFEALPWSLEDYQRAIVENAFYVGVVPVMKQSEYIGEESSSNNIMAFVQERFYY